jgi:hypothetical protein
MGWSKARWAGSEGQLRGRLGLPLSPGGSSEVLCPGRDCVQARTTSQTGPGRTEEEEEFI